MTAPVQFFVKLLPKYTMHISLVVDASCPVQLYVVGRDGILIPVNTHLGSSTENYSQPSDSDPNNHMITKLHESTVQLMDRPPLVQTSKEVSPLPPIILI